MNIDSLMFLQYYPEYLLWFVLRALAGHVACVELIKMARIEEWKSCSVTKARFESLGRA